MTSETTVARMRGRFVLASVPPFHRSTIPAWNISADLS